MIGLAEWRKDLASVGFASAGDSRIDAALLQRVGSGDHAALGELYDRHARVAYSLAARLVGPTSAEDVVHDAFVALLNRADGFDPDRGTFRAWFLTSVHRRCLNLLRSGSRVVVTDTLPEIVDGDPDPADAVVGRLRDGAVRTALVRLAPAQREVLVLAYYGGLSQSALAERLRVPLGTVKARTRRGLLALRELLGGEARDDPASGAAPASPPDPTDPEKEQAP